MTSFLNERYICIILQTSAQQALTGTINSSMQAVQAAQATLDDFDTLPPLGTDSVTTASSNHCFCVEFCC